MCTLVEARIQAGQFALGETLESVRDAEFRMVRLVAHGGESALPFLWARGEDRTALTDAMEDDPSVERVEVLSSVDDEWLVSVEWRAPVRHLFAAVDGAGGAVLDARSDGGTWDLQFLFPKHDGVSAVYDRCEAAGIDVSFDRICDVSDRSGPDGLRLTDEQYQTISRAYETGYYDVPRRINQEELADSFDVSHQALSERLRRGHRTIIANALFRGQRRPDRSVAPRAGSEVDA